MSRKENVSVVFDVDAICELQRRIDAYEFYIIGLAGHSSPDRDSGRYAIPFRGTEMDEWVRLAWSNITELKRNADGVKDV